MNKSTASLPASATTGFRPVGQVPVNTTGSRLGEIGSGRPLIASGALASMRPAETEARMTATLQQLAGQPPVFKMRTMLPNDGPIYEVVQGIEWACPGSCLAEAAEIIAAGFRSAPAAEISAALVSLRRLTRGREPLSAEDREGEYVIWIEKLRCYPADIVLDTLRSWRSEWWPTWHEVAMELDHRTAKRKALAYHIRALIERPQAPALPSPPSSATPEQRERALVKWEAEKAQAVASIIPTSPKAHFDSMCAELGIDPATIPNALPRSA